MIISMLVGEKCRTICKGNYQNQNFTATRALRVIQTICVTVTVIGFTLIASISCFQAGFKRLGFNQELHTELIFHESAIMQYDSQSLT
jgi:hypothetical protein